MYLYPTVILAESLRSQIGRSLDKLGVAVVVAIGAVLIAVVLRLSFGYGLVL